jgi:hypothetical protein
MGGASEPWHLDKRVNLALVGALLIQTSGIVWWASAMHSTLQTEVATNDRQDAILDALKADVQVKADRFSEAQRNLSEQLVDQRADLRAIRELMQRIEVRLDQTQTPRRP